MDIIKNRKIFYAISIIVILIGAAFMIFNAVNGNGAFNLDIEFTGGTSISCNIGEEFNNDDITAIVKENAGVDCKVQKEDGNNVSIKTQELDKEKADAVKAAICEKYSAADENSFEVENIGATISGEMTRAAILSVVIACVIMLAYITLRFRDLKTGASCVVALFHDVIIVVCSYAVLRIPLNNSFIAAVLTILGYSINASIIIFDRIRENKRKISGRDNAELVNRSVMQTIRRSIFTSLTTFFTIAALYVFGVPSVKEFALPIVIGIICGTYSSVFIAGSIWYTISNFKVKKA